MGKDHRFLSSTLRLLVALISFWVVGAYVNHGAELWSDILFARECVLLYAFYLLGLLLRRTQVLEGLSFLARFALFLFSSALLLGTFNLNPLSDDIMPVVLINLSQHGSPYYFAVTALAGCFAVVGLSLLTPNWKWLSWIGRHTLLLMGCNGFFFAFVNKPLARAVALADSHPVALFWISLFTILSLAASVPIALLLDRYVPQLIGRPRAAGPLLPKLM